MLYTEIIAVCSQIHTKHKNTLCGQNVELLNVKLAVRIVTTELCEDNFTIGTAPPDSHPTAVFNQANRCLQHRLLYYSTEKRPQLL